tara:strand:- start:100 stop:510 length:411 start_codon:yes stop_codon:yes gene_type:complete
MFADYPWSLIACQPLPEVIVSTVPDHLQTLQRLDKVTAQSGKIAGRRRMAPDQHEIMTRPRQHWQHFIGQGAQPALDPVPDNCRAELLGSGEADPHLGVIAFPVKTGRYGIDLHNETNRRSTFATAVQSNEITTLF